ncbi:MAG: penicillin-binding protein 2 [Rickettsiales bacterium]|nr:MAG: penicillin-binding protein 2 [Rickettsiales bacterium]
MKNNFSKQFTLDKRTFIVMFLFFFLSIILIIRLYYLTIKKHDYYRQLALENRTKKVYIPPLRGIIYDRQKRKLVNNNMNYLLNIDYLDEDQTVFLLNVLDYDNNEKETLLTKRETKQRINDSTYIKVSDLQKNINIRLNLFKYPNIGIEEIFDREYIFPTTFSHIIGYTGAPSPTEIKARTSLYPKSLLMHPEFKVGKYGIEKIYNAFLTGDYGYYNLEVFAKNKTNELYKKEQTIGNNIYLTLDLQLQQYIEKRMRNIDGAIIVMDVNTGEILSMFSNPTFDINKLNDVNNSKYWNLLLTNPAKPLINKTISTYYPPGSTFKLMTAIAGLESGWDYRRTIGCSGEEVVDTAGRILHCWYKKGHGNINLISAIKHSCNIYMNRIGTYAGIEKIYEVATNFGFGENFELALSNVVKGIIPNREWKRKVYKDSWVKGDTTNISIGQGFLAVTPLELVVMTSRIANGGYPIKPYINMNSPNVDYNKNLFTNQKTIAKKQHLDIVREGMYKVVNEAGGTTYSSRIYNKEYEMAGKTGTAQVISKDTMKSLKASKQNLTRLQNHALFVGFAPYSNPKYAIIVVSEFGQSGSGAAAPIARDILTFAQENDI